MYSGRLSVGMVNCCLPSFMRAHRSILIAVNKITTIESSSICEGEAELPSDKPVARLSATLFWIETGFDKRLIGRGREWFFRSDAASDGLAVVKRNPTA